MHNSWQTSCRNPHLALQHREGASDSLVGEHGLGVDLVAHGCWLAACCSGVICSCLRGQTTALLGMARSLYYVSPLVVFAQRGS